MVISIPARRTIARWSVILAIAVATVSLSGAAATSADGDLPGGGSFLDDDGMSEEGFIEAIAAIGVTRGCNPPTNDRFCPNDTVTRSQMASFLVRALTLPAAPNANSFTDDDGSVHEDDIASLAFAGITRGCNPPANDRFCPNRNVSRGEMAAFLSRAFDYEAPADSNRFTDDDDSIFQADIERIAHAGITSGCGPAIYCPDAPMLRRHMAVFLARALGLTPMTPPPRPRVIGTFTTRHDCCKNRVYNIHLIADAVDGAVVAAGETWSLNGYVGQRTTAKGYRAAGAIVGGVLVCCDHPDNIGGGTSQFATTLYNAIFFAGLEDVRHKPHSIYFSRYPLGHEATLGWTWPDVVFRNDTPYPLTIETSYTSTRVTVTIVGYNGNRDVDVSVSGTATTSTGGSVEVTRVITQEDGTQTSRTWTHTYTPWNPPADPDPVPEPEPDPDGGGGGGPVPL